MRNDVEFSEILKTNPFINPLVFKPDSGNANGKISKWISRILKEKVIISKTFDLSNQMF